MTEPVIKFSDLTRQDDGVWARHSLSELHGFTASPFYDSIAAGLKPEDISYDPRVPGEESWDLFQYSPLSANTLRAFGWHARSRVLEIGCGAGATTLFLASQNLNVDALEPDRALAQLAALRTRTTDSVRIVAEPLTSLDFESSRYDAIILSGSDQVLDCLGDHPELAFSEAVATVLESCKSLLTEQGRIYFSIENEFAIDRVFSAASRSQTIAGRIFDPVSYRPRGQPLSLQGWRELLSGIFSQLDEYYLFPSVHLPRVLLGSAFTSANPAVFQHLAWHDAKTGFKSSARMVNESLLQQVAAINGYLGELANGYFFVLSQASARPVQQLDFAHLPDFRRRPEYVSVVLKKTGHDETERLKVTAVENPGQSRIEQRFEAEKYHSGIALSVLWRNSLIVDPRGIQFEQFLLRYFAYLKQLDSGVIAGMNIDAIANNIIVGPDNEYHLIDLEWHLPDEKLKSDYVFYRGVLHFAIRNASIFDDFRWINGLATLGDFAVYCFRIIGLNIGVGELETFRKRDCQFQCAVMLHSEGYSLSDPLGVEVEIQTSLCRLNWRYQDGHYHPHQQQVCRASVDNQNQLLKFRIPASSAEAGVDGCSGRPVACFRFFPFEYLQAPGAGYFGIDSLIVRCIAEDSSSHDLLVLENSDQVSQANIHRGIFYGKKEDRHVFMFNNNDTFLEFELPLDTQDVAQFVEIDLDFRLSPSHDYETARHRYALAEREIETIKQIKNAEIDSLKEALDDITREYYQFKESRVWRLLVAYRDSFKISGYPKKNLFQKLAHMVRLIKQPRPEDDR